MQGMKKQLQLFVLILATCSIATKAQNDRALRDTYQNNVKVDEAPFWKCGSEVPPGKWNTWTAEQIAELEKNNYNVSKQQAIKYTIPVVFHILHNGTSIGTDINISQAQIIDQINILNADMKSQGLNNTLCPDSFLSVKADIEISFCLATKNPTGGVLVEPGIDRIPWASVTSSSLYPYSYTTMESIVKPATIWNPLYYCNIWVTSLPPLNKAWATYPSGTSLPCLSASIGSDTTDGIVCSPYIIGSVGTATTPPFNKGRILAHEVGHWLGLLHLNGDTNCGTDCVSDTPPQEILHGGCNSSSSTPFHVNYCGAGTSPNGEMTMNFMENGEDLCVYMWTVGQKARMQQAMTQGTYRNQLNASAATICDPIDISVNESILPLSNITIFPNPSTGVFNFEIVARERGNFNFLIMNSIGQVIYSKIEKATTNSIITIDLTHLPKGIYFANVTNSKGEKIRKALVIE